MPPGTPLGDCATRHDADVAIVKELIRALDKVDPRAPEWRARIGRVADALNKHATDEEGQIFGRIEQVWDPQELAQIGAEMLKSIDASQRAPALRGQPTKTRAASHRSGR